MIEQQGSLAGIVSSPKPARGPQAYRPTSLAIFINARASVRSVPLTLTMLSCAASAANLLGAEKKGLTVSAAIRRAATSPKRASALSPVPTAVPPIARA
jgi:hypothetical protein